MILKVGDRVWVSEDGEGRAPHPDMRGRLAVVASANVERGRYRIVLRNPAPLERDTEAVVSATWLSKA